MRPRIGTLVLAGLAGACLLALPSRFLFGQEVLRPEPAGGPETIRVVESFDPATETRTREVVPHLSSVEILRIQRALQREGYPTAGARGELDGATREALGRFQRERGLEVCACPSYETVVALGLSPVVVQTVLARPPSRPDREPAPPVEVIYPKAPAERAAPPDESDAEGEITLSRAELEAVVQALASALRDSAAVARTEAIFGTPFFLPHLLFVRSDFLGRLDAASLERLLRRLREEGLILGPEREPLSRSQPLGRTRDRDGAMRTRPAPPPRVSPPEASGRPR